MRVVVAAFPDPGKFENWTACDRFLSHALACAGLIEFWDMEFADAALRLFNDAALRATLSECGQNYIKQHHNWWSIAGQFVEVYEQAIAAHRQRTSSSYRWGTATTKTLEPVQRSGD